MFNNLNPVLHQQLRLAVISLLISVREADFVYLRQKTGATAGNLSVQLEKLCEAKYITISKAFKGKRPQTNCIITPLGVEAFEKYVTDLKTYINVTQE